MGLDYALVHIKFTIPLALILTIACRPLLTRLEGVKIACLIFIAFTATVPWDSYLIRTGVWTYPGDGVLGYSLFSIPVEELFFFVIQTYITSLVYILCNKPVLQAQFLYASEAKPRWVSAGQALGQAVLVAATALGVYFLAQADERTYLGLILAWACPFALLTWSLAGDMMVAMPWTSTVLPIAAPTVYLWFVDELSLRSGFWTIEAGTKLGSNLFGSLDVEEAVFFLVTNVLVVFGLAAFDQACAACDAFPDRYPEPADSLPVQSLVAARIAPLSRGDARRAEGIREAVARLQRKSRSFYIASSVFPGRLRIDLTLLYSYCRLADDLVDEAPNMTEALRSICKLRTFLDISYGKSKSEKLHGFIRENFERSAHSALDLLPTEALSPEPLYALLEGFEMDLQFENAKAWPIHEEDELELYASRVASTVGRLCLDLVFYHSPHSPNKEMLQNAAHEMGTALQYVNIARDIAVDAAMDRVYLPTTWLREEDEGLTPETVVTNPSGDAVEKLRSRLLARAFEKYRASRPQMDMLPREARGPMIAAVESYMEIGRVLVEGGRGRRRGEMRATVPLGRRMWIVWRTLMDV